ncbi:hypothetical protein J3R30DRAFT_3437216 [Lentinula aciculospora]|uniref:F-box domain-containing protein n=1 Tax=Lentinula aciculospora TaxID=153920 RepID=A0A9W9DWD9_9AGAR|nr:hypothetical protein J3R30DRAFT_3503012 [Lentinula aciculospora]KAJ4488556.1 hypothetical protein J3R30DRAFT_3437216 [Lentinula aciculospora]
MENRLSKLLVSNNVPTEEDVGYITDLCSESAQELDRLNHQILQLQSSLQSITGKRDELQKKLDVYRAVLSPLRRCPTEILQQIFTWTLESFPILSSDEGPLFLGRICSRWRSISIATPELWSAVHVTVPEALHTFQEFNVKCERLRHGFSTWLQRAGMLPLHISVFSRNEDTYQEDVPQVARTLSLLVPLCKQWKYLSLQVPASSLHVFSELRGIDVPQLESAVIACSDSNPFVLDHASRHPPFLETAPFLRRINLGDAGPLFRPVVPWNQLHFLSLDYNDWNFGAQELMHILAKCTELRECVLIIHARTDLTTTLDNPISLPHLEKLSVSTNSIVMAEVLDQLSLPSLRHLHLEGYRAELNTIVLASLKGMLHRSQYPLQSLKLDVKRSTNLTTSLVIDLLRAMPSLKALVFTESSTQTPIIDEELLKALSNSEDLLCPRLEIIHLPDRFTFSELTLEQFLAMRLDPTLKEVTMLRAVYIVSYRRGLAERFARYGERVNIVEDIPYRNLPYMGRPLSRLIEYSDEY